MNYISQNIKLLRKQFNLTQDELAVQIDNKRHNIAAWEDGRGGPGVENLLKISNLFNIPLNDLISTPLDDNYFNMITEPTPPIPAMSLNSCMKLVEFLESELRTKNETIKSLLDLMRDFEQKRM